MEVFIEIFDLIKAAPFNLALLLAMNIAMGAYIALYAIPELRKRADSSAKVTELEAELLVKENLLKTSKPATEPDVISEQLKGILELCQHTNKILADHIGSIETEMSELSEEVKEVQAKLLRLRNTKSADKLKDIELEMRIMGQQLANIINRLASVTGILVGSSPALGDLLNGLGESTRDLK